jgi:hypothetical protein
LQLPELTAAPSAVLRDQKSAHLAQRVDHDLPAAKALEARRVEAYDRLLELITRAKNTGYLREDSTHQDVVILLIANAGVVTATGDSAPDTWRRLVGHMIRSYAAPGAPIPPLS